MFYKEKGYLFNKKGLMFFTYLLNRVGWDTDLHGLNGFFI